jgi:hypothetical protein
MKSEIDRALELLSRVVLQCQSRQCKISARFDAVRRLAHHHSRPGDIRRMEQARLDLERAELALEKAWAVQANLKALMTMEARS